VGGTTHLIRVAGFDGANGAYTLNIAGDGGTGPVNDLCANASSVGAGSFSGTTTGADDDGSNSCTFQGFPSTNSVWYSHTPVSSGPLTIDTVGSAFDTVLSVHSACPGTAANEVACNDDIGSNLQSSVTFSAVGGTTYLIRVAGFNGANGPYSLKISGAPSRFDLNLDGLADAADVVTLVNFINGGGGGGTGNDLCTDAAVVGPGIFTGSTAGADDDGSNSCTFMGFPSTNSVWYSYTPASSASVMIDTVGSLFDTVLSVHSACPGTAANEVACNDDIDGPGGNLLSSVTFSAVGGTTHLIRVAGFNGANGPYTLNISGPDSSASRFDLNLDGLVDAADVVTLVNFINGVMP
jgi:hypothetical protein